MASNYNDFINFMSFPQAGSIVGQLKRKSGSIRSLCFAPQVKNKKEVYALVCETLRYSSVIDKIMKAHPLLKKKFQWKEGLCRVLVYNYVIDKHEKDWKSNKRSGADVTELLPFKTLLTSFMNSLITRTIRESSETLLPSPKILLPLELQNSVELPRYVRVNTIKRSFEEAIEYFELLNFEYIEPPKNVIDIPITVGGQKQFWADADLDNILVFPCGTDLHADEWVASGNLILQDKASCLSAIVLLEDCTPAANELEASPTRFCNVIDACAAPGNKTTHAGALMARSKHHHNLIAVDKDDKRILLLKSFTGNAGADVRILHQSFLDIDSTDPQHGHITHLMVDPSCSGSGIVSRLDSLLNLSGFTAKRKEQLAKFQKKILCHALSFVHAQRVVYSTCSIFEEENEQVVRDVLDIVGENWELHKVLPEWKHRGLEKYPVGEYCIRASPLEDHTNGFFVARFHRKTSTIPTPTTGKRTEPEICERPLPPTKHIKTNK